MAERQLQKQIEKDINRTELFWAVSVDAKPVWFKGRWIKSRAKSGVSDLLVFCRLDNRIILMEIKQPGKTLTPNQKKFRELCQMNNVIYGVTNSVLGALQNLQYWVQLWGYRDRQLEAILSQM